MESLFLIKIKESKFLFISQLHNKLFTICLHSNITTHLHHASNFLQLGLLMCCQIKIREGQGQKWRK